MAALTCLLGCAEHGAESPSRAQEPHGLDGRASDGLLNRPDLQVLVEAGLGRNVAPLVEALSDPDPAVRARAAYTLGSVQDPGTRAALARLLQDPEPHVRQDAAFALGQLSSPSAAPDLVTALARETDPSARVLLAEAIGKVGDRSALAELVELLEMADVGADRTSWATGLYHFGRRRIVDPAAGGFLVESVLAPSALASELAALALAAPRSVEDWGVTPRQVLEALEGLPMERPAAGPLLEVLGREGDDSAAAVIGAWLKGSPEWRVRVAAARALRRWVASGNAGVRQTLATSVDDESVHVAVAAASVLASQGFDGGESERWGAWIGGHRDRPAVAAALLPGLAEPIASRIALGWARGEYDPGARPLLAFPTLSRLDEPEADNLLVEALDRDRRTTYAAASALVDRLRRSAPGSPLHTTLFPIILRRARAWGPHAPMSDMRGLLGIVEVLSADGGPARDTLLALAASHPHPAMRDLARRLGARVPPVPRSVPRPVDWARLRDAGAHPRIRVVTDGGDFVVELDAESAPLAVSALLEWAGTGAYSGLPFHRVEPAFVLQSGDFDATAGYGGPERGLMSEFTRIRYLPGTMGMASAGKDTEGSQYFVTHGLSPSLDGRYAAVGRVILGKAVADAVGPWDLVRAVARITGEEGGS